MPVTATLLGSAITSGFDPVVPITVSQPTGAIVFVVAAAYTTSNIAIDQGFRAVPTDSVGGTWNFTSPRPFIGNTGDNFGVVGTVTAGNVMGVSRTGGPDLTAGSGPQPRPGCTTCGSMLLGTPTGTLGGGGGGGGSTVTLHMLNAEPVPPDPVLAMVIALEGVQNRVETDDQSQYGNGDQYPSSSGNPAALNWQADFGLPFVPKPDADAVLYTGVTAYGTNGWVPANGSVLAELDAAPGYLAVHFDTLALAGVRVEPGGTFAGPASMSAANYQFVRLL